MGIPARRAPKRLCFWLRSGREGEAQTMSDVRLSPRERLVLTAIIDQYIATGEPVASQAVARLFADREGLSSATLRNVMATLGRCRTPGAAAYFGGPRSYRGGFPLLRGTDYAARPRGGGRRDLSRRRARNLR